MSTIKRADVTQKHVLSLLVFSPPVTSSQTPPAVAARPWQLLHAKQQRLAACRSRPSKIRKEMPCDSASDTPKRRQAEK